MSIESKVFEKLFTADKVELASQKYELGFYDDIKSYLSLTNLSIKNAKSNEDSAFALLDKLNLAISKSKDAVKASDDILKKSSAVIAELNQAGKSFGFDPKSTDAYKLNTELLNSINALNQFGGLGKIIASRIITN
jgi:hypothetical protein